MADVIILNLNELTITIIIKRLIEKSFKWSNYTLTQTQTDWRKKDENIYVPRNINRRKLGMGVPISYK